MNIFEQASLFLKAKKYTRVHIRAHVDLDGMTSLACLHAALKTFGMQVATIGVWTWTKPSNLQAIAELTYPGELICVLDLGTQDYIAMPEVLHGRYVLVVDHHQFNLADYRQHPQLCVVHPKLVGETGLSTATLTYYLAKHLLGQADQHLATITTIGAFADRSDLNHPLNRQMLADSYFTAYNPEPTTNSKTAIYSVLINNYLPPPTSLQEFELITSMLDSYSGNASQLAEAISQRILDTLTPVEREDYNFNLQQLQQGRYATTHFWQNKVLDSLASITSKLNKAVNMCGHDNYIVKLVLKALDGYATPTEFETATKHAHQQQVKQAKTILDCLLGYSTSYQAEAVTNDKFFVGQVHCEPEIHPKTLSMVNSVMANPRSPYSYTLIKQTVNGYSDELAIGRAVSEYLARIKQKLAGVVKYVAVSVPTQNSHRCWRLRIVATPVMQLRIQAGTEPPVANGDSGLIETLLNLLRKEWGRDRVGVGGGHTVVGNVTLFGDVDASFLLELVTKAYTIAKRKL